MGQYYKVCLKADDGTKAFFKPRSVKLMEHSWLDNQEVNAIVEMLHHTPMTVVWCGDYSDGNLPVRTEDGTVEWVTKYGRLSVEESQEIYGSCHGYSRAKTEPIPHPGDGWTLEGRFLVDHDRREFIDVDRYTRASGENEMGRTVHPLPVLTAAGNGLGGGDYYGSCSEYAGRWCGDRVSVEDAPPEGFAELLVFFREGHEHAADTTDAYLAVRDAVDALRMAYRGAPTLPMNWESIPFDGAEGGLVVSVSFTDADGKPSETELTIPSEFFADVMSVKDFWQVFRGELGELWDGFARENGVVPSAISVDAPLPDAVGGDPAADIRKAAEDFKESRGGEAPSFSIEGGRGGIRFVMHVDVLTVDEESGHFDEARFEVGRGTVAVDSGDGFWPFFTEALCGLWARYKADNGLFGVRAYGIRVKAEPGSLSSDGAAALLPEMVAVAAAGRVAGANADTEIRAAIDALVDEGVLPEGLRPGLDEMDGMIADLLEEDAQEAEASTRAGDIALRWAAGKLRELSGN